MKYQIVQSKISMDKRDLVILSWQISHQPVRQLVHGRNVSGRGGFILLCPSCHLLTQSTSAALFLKNIFIYRVQRPHLPVSCSSLILFQILRGSVTPGPVSVVSPGLPLQQHRERPSLLRSHQEDADPEIYGPVQTRDSIRNMHCFLSWMPVSRYILPTYRMSAHKQVRRMEKSLWCNKTCLYVFHHIKLCSNDLSIGAEQQRLRNRESHRIQSFLDPKLPVHLQTNSKSKWHLHSVLQKSHFRGVGL